MLEAGVRREASRKHFHAGGIREAARVARKIDALEAPVGGEGTQGLSKGCLMLQDLLLHIFFDQLRNRWQCGGRFAWMLLILVGKIQVFEFAALGLQQFGNGVEGLCGRKSSVAFSGTEIIPREIQ